MTIDEQRRAIATALTPRYGVGEARMMARIVMEHVTGKNNVSLMVDGDKPLSDFRRGQVRGIVDRLLAGEPLQYITGEAPFYGMTFKVTPATLIPRPETAELVDMIVDAAASRPDLRVLDIGTGSGCIAIALCRNLLFPEVTALDLSAEALAVARENARLLKCRVDFMQADAFAMECPRGPLYDIIVSNPPYVADSERAGMEANVLDHEPSSALFVPDDDPVVFYRAISRYAACALSRGGYLFFEVNPLFADATVAVVSGAGMADVEVLPDSYGRKRFVKARRL